MFSIEKHKIFLIQVFDLRFFKKKIHATTVSVSKSVSESELVFRIRIQPKHSDSFGFGSTTLIGSDSEYLKH
jgi:hypothetical protein